MHLISRNIILWCLMHALITLITLLGLARSKRWICVLHPLTGAVGRISQVPLLSLSLDLHSDAADPVLELLTPLFWREVTEVFWTGALQMNNTYKHAHTHTHTKTEIDSGVVMVLYNNKNTREGNSYLPVWVTAEGMKGKVQKVKIMNICILMYFMSSHFQ